MNKKRKINGQLEREIMRKVNNGEFGRKDRI